MRVSQSGKEKKKGILQNAAPCSGPIQGRPAAPRASGGSPPSSADGRDDRLRDFGASSILASVFPLAFSSVPGRVSTGDFSEHECDMGKHTTSHRKKLTKDASKELSVFGLPWWSSG